MIFLVIGLGITINILTCNSLIGINTNLNFVVQKNLLI